MRSTPSRHFVDPSLAVAALRTSPKALPANLEYLGLLFESLVIRDLRVAAQDSPRLGFAHTESVGSTATPHASGPIKRPAPPLATPAYPWARAAGQREVRIMRIGFVGVGNMGGPMSRNLAQAGHEVRAFDIDSDRLAAAAASGATAAASAIDAVRNAEAVITMLPASRHVTGLYLQDGLLDAIELAAIVADCSTIAPAAAQEVAAAARDRGIDMLDAPVSGGTAGAEQGTLTFMVGGAAKTLERMRPLFECMGANVFHAGDCGAGQTAKVCNNMLLAVQMTATSEALALGAANGLDPAVLSEIMRKSSGGNWPLNVYNPWPGVMESAPASRRYQGGFLVDLMLKDLDLALDAAARTGASIALGALARNLYATHRRANNAGNLDFSSILRLVAEDAKSGSAEAPK